MKLCNKCLQNKNLNEFYNDKTKKTGKCDVCKLCTSERSKIYYLNNRENILKNIKFKYDNDIEYRKKFINNQKIYRSNLTDEERKYKNSISRESKRKRMSDPVYREKQNNYKRELRKKNINFKKRENASSVLYKKTRRKEDKLFYFKERSGCLIRGSFKRKNLKKSRSTEFILGCSIEFFKEYIEKQFTKGMTWDNQSEWHIDHIIPLALADSYETVCKLNHYTNLRPEWAKINLTNKDKGYSKDKNKFLLFKEILKIYDVKNNGCSKLQDLFKKLESL